MKTDSSTQLASLFGGLIYTSDSIKCKKCGKLLAPYYYAMQTHNKYCGKIKRNKTIACKKINSIGIKLIVFYDKGQIHCMSYCGIGRYVGLSGTTIKGRMESNLNKWTIEQILEKEPKPILKSGKKHKPTKKESNEKSILKPDEAIKQNLLMKLGK